MSILGYLLDRFRRPRMGEPPEPAPPSPPIEASTHDETDGD